MGHDLSQDAEIWDDAYKLDRAHVFHSWHAQRNLDPTEVVTGCLLYTSDAADEP